MQLRSLASPDYSGIVASREDVDVGWTGGLKELLRDDEVAGELVTEEYECS